MALLSPGIEVNEIDKSQVSNTAVGFAAAYVGSFKKGPSSTATLISSESELSSVFGAPDKDTVEDYMTVKAYLSYASSIYVNRAVDSTYNKKTELTATITNVSKNVITLDGVGSFEKGQHISFDDIDTVYVIEKIDSNDNTITLDVDAENVQTSSKIYLRTGAVNAWCETPATGFTPSELTTTSAGNLLIENDTDYDAQETSVPFTAGTKSKLRFTARTAGAHGNKLKVAIVTPENFENNDSVTDSASVQDLFQYDCTDKQFGVVILEGSTILETYRVSYDQEEKDGYNNSMYVEKVINRQSSYVFVKDNTSVDAAPASCIGDNIVKLTNGANGEAGKKNVVEALNVFSDKEQIEISYIIAHRDAVNECIELAETRADCIAFVNAPKEAVIGLKADKIMKNVLEHRASIKNSKYVGYFDNFCEMYNSSLDAYVYVPSAAHIAGKTAALDEAGSFAMASAGSSNGLLSNVNKLAWSSSKAIRDQFYRKDINSIINDVSSGIMCFGGKTTYGIASSFDRLTTRRLFNYLERVVSTTAKAVLFEINDAITRNSFVSMIDPVFNNLKSRRQMSDYRIVCDETNNPDTVVEKNQFICTLMIKPSYSIEFITLNFVAVKQSMSFDEVEGI